MRLVVVVVIASLSNGSTANRGGACGGGGETGQKKHVQVVGSAQMIDQRARYATIYVSIW